MRPRDDRPAPQVRLQHGPTDPDVVTSGPERAAHPAARWLPRAAVVAAAAAVVVVLVRGGPAGVPAPAPTPSPLPPVSVTATARLYVSSCEPATVYRLQDDGTPARLTGTPAQGSAGQDGRPVAAGRSDCPEGLAFDRAGVLRVVDRDAGRVRLVQDGGVVTTLDGTPTDPRRALGLRALLASPDAVAVGRDGTVYVAAPASTRVRRVDAAGVLGPLSGGAVAERAAEPARPAQLAVDDELAVFFADGGTNSVFKVDRNGRVTTVAGTGAATSSGDGGPAGSAALDDPRAVAMDRQGRLYVTEGAGHRVRRVETDGTISTVAGTGRSGSGGDGGPATAATLRSPGDVAVDGSGLVYVVDLASGAVRRIGTDGRIDTLGT